MIEDLDFRGRYEPKRELLQPVRVFFMFLAGWHSAFYTD